jgi:hypothetical protein
VSQSAKFIQYKQNKIINLSRVSNIGIIYEPKPKIVFNMDYAVTLRTKQTQEEKLISDYVYWDALSLDDFYDMKDLIDEQTADWIYYNDKFRIVNPDKISSIVFDEEKSINRYKIIFNLSHTVSMREGGMTSEFVYYKFDDSKSFNDYKLNFIQTLGIII